MSSIDNDPRFSFLNPASAKDKWFVSRHGKFTASKIGCLCVPGSKGALFGEGAKTYIRQRATEKMTTITDRPEMEYVKSIRHGKDLEVVSFGAYQRYTRNYDMRYFGSEQPLFLDFDENSGGSPDGMCGHDEKIYCGLELKCPSNSDIHVDYCEMTHQHELEAYNLEYYAQIQFLLMITEAPMWHFCSFDERFTVPGMRIGVLEIEPDLPFQNKLKMRLKAAVGERDKIIAGRLAKMEQRFKIKAA